MVKRKSIRKIVKEEIELALERIWTRVKRPKKHGNHTSARTNMIMKSRKKCGNQTSARTNMKLKFMNTIAKNILTGEEIKGEGSTPMEVALVDDSTGNTVEVGPEASAKVAIVLLKGEHDASEGDDWTVEEFNQNIVPKEKGKKPLLAGNVYLKLQNGIGVLQNIKFRHGANKIRPSVFKLGARVVDASDGSRIKEAKTESFTVKDYRNKYYKKHKTPSLSDEVSRLCNIRKGGKIAERLRDKKIYTVEDFLIQLLIDREGLKRIVKLGTKRWEETVNNARACSSNKRMYCYMDLKKKMVIVFNVLGEVPRLFSCYSTMTMSLEKHKADVQELLASAYKNWENVKAFEDVNSLEQHLTSLSTDMEPLDSPKLNYPAVGHEKTGTSEMRGESSSQHFNILFQGITSTVNPIRESGGGDFGSFFSTDDVETVDAVFTQGSPVNPETISQGFFQQNDHCNKQHNGDTRMIVARSESFVKDDHGELYKKHHPPSLSDEVWRLEKIGKDGAFHKCLMKEGINTVQDFLTLLFLDPTRLQNILGADMSAEIWEVTVAHARTCVLDKKSYFCGASPKNGVVFNVVGQVMGIFSNGQYVHVDKLSEEEKANAHEWVISGFADREKIVSFDDSSPPITPTSSSSSIFRSFSNFQSEGRYHEESPTSQKVDGSSYLQQIASSPIHMQSLYSADLRCFDDCLQCADPLSCFDHHLGYPGQVAGSLIDETDTMHLAHSVDDFETDCEIGDPHMDLSAEIQGAVNASLPYSDVHNVMAQIAQIAQIAQRRWRVLVSILKLVVL